MTDREDPQRCIIIGGGPAGLTAADELCRLERPACVFESDAVVGGIARTVAYRGYRFDIGGHRFFTKVPVVQQRWEEVLGGDMLQRSRLSRIFYGSRFFDYPLRPANALLGLGPVEAVRIGASWLRAQLFPERDERTFEDWVSNRFGRRLFEIFFKTYTEKVWGMPCSEISADWAAQRIRNLDLLTAVRNAFLGGRSGQVVTSLIEQFHYPRLGPGMMWERVRDRVEAQGVPVHMGTRVSRLQHAGGRIRAAEVCDADGPRVEAGAHFLSSMPIRELILALDPPAPEAVQAAARRLRYRDFLTVGLILDREPPFEDNWIYVHSPAVRVGRIQNYRQWSPEMVPGPDRWSLGLEYFVQEGDDLWSQDDKELIALARRECAQLGLVPEADVSDGVVIRMPKAYPVYDDVYREALAVIREYLSGFSNLQLIGRNGQHRYNNQDHSMLTAIYAAQNVAGAQHDVWDVNVDEDYHEEVARSGATGDRAVPERLQVNPVEELLREAFARLDPVALGGAVGIVLGFGLALATAVLLLRGGEGVGTNLSLLAWYLPGFRVTWGGALLALFEAGALGFLFGYGLARTINGVVALHERLLLRRLALMQALRGVEGGQS
ncbi:MAG: NAD(P)/FAD-dependent oxidoreductase [Proteobacteria bacterium]|nr:NAD(P)/FAD-dependent oxidoreductase [Pseudomonadota bacterium]